MMNYTERKNLVNRAINAMKSASKADFKAAYLFAAAYNDASDDDASALDIVVDANVDRREAYDRRTVGRFTEIDGTTFECAAFSSFGAALMACKRLNLASAVKSGNMTDDEARKALADYVGGRVGIKSTTVRDDFKKAAAADKAAAANDAVKASGIPDGDAIDERHAARDAARDALYNLYRKAPYDADVIAILKYVDAAFPENGIRNQYLTEADENARALTFINAADVEK